MMGRVGAYVWGEDASRRLPGAAASGRRRSVTTSTIDRLAGPLDHEDYAGPGRGRVVDKPAAVAHYRAMAEQVAHERQASIANRTAGYDIVLVERPAASPRGGRRG